MAVENNVLKRKLPDEHDSSDDEEVTKKKLITKAREKRSIVEIKELPLRQLCLFNYYKRILKQEPEIEDALYNININKKPISNRGLENLITNYSRDYNLVLNENGQVDDNGEFYVADEYFKHLPKTDTDPCRRAPLIVYECKGKIMETTIPQLGSNISICRSPSIKYAEKYAKVILNDLNKRKNLPQRKSSIGVESPKIKEYSAFRLVPKSVTINLP